MTLKLNLQLKVLDRLTTEESEITVENWPMKIMVIMVKKEAWGRMNERNEGMNQWSQWSIALVIRSRIVHEMTDD